VLVAAGNSGPGLFSIGSPATFKNGIAVGATQNSWQSFLNIKKEDFKMPLIDPNQIKQRNDLFNEFNLASFSSRGPTCDGRNKPDICAPGSQILSSRSGHEECLSYKQGTSMACPTLAKIVAFYRQTLMNRYKVISPSSALIRNLLFCSAIDLKEGLDVEVRYNPLTHFLWAGVHSYNLTQQGQGYGRVSIEALEKDWLRWKDRELIKSFEKPKKYCFKAKVNQKTEVSIGLVWTDPPSMLGIDGPVLVNDLNLRVIVKRLGSVDVILGNHLNIPDTLNNAERVRFNVIPSDEIDVIISSKSPLVFNEQAYSLVYSKVLVEADCDEQCSLWEPEYECLTHKGDIGIVKCTNGTYEDSKCMNICKPGYVNTTDSCVCYAHIPCLDDKHFAYCNDTILSNCTHLGTIFNHYETIQILNAQSEMRILSTPEPVDQNVWFVCMIVTLIGIFISFYFWKPYKYI
jgi:hypothetical protein